MVTDRHKTFLAGRTLSMLKLFEKYIVVYTVLQRYLIYPIRTP